jgi:serine/threonine protein kinase
VGPLPVEQAVLYALQACDAVASAHAVGIIHRDLKPANLFLARGPEGESMIKVLDFGISKSIEQLPHGRSQSLTDVGAVLGSPRYMAPEQVRDVRHVDARADLWSLGVVLYELLVGAPMFRGSTVEVLGALLADDPLPRVRVARSEVPEELDAVLTRCMRRAPAERIASATELSLALAPFGPPEAASLVLRAARRLGARGAGLTAGLAPEAPNPYDIINRPSALVAVKTALPPAAAAPALRRASLGGLVALSLLALVALASLGAGLSRSHPVPTSASSMLASSAEGPSGGALLSADLDAEGEPAPAGSSAPPSPSGAPPEACALLAESSATPPRATPSPRVTKRASELDAGVLRYRH